MKGAKKKDNKQIRLFLKELRIKHKLTQKDLADILVITPQTVSKWELGTSIPNLDMLLSLSKLYKVSVDEIIQCEIKQEEKYDKISIENIIVLGLYLLILGLAIAIPFINFIIVDSSYLEYGWFYNPEIFPIIPIALKLSSWWVITLLLFLPVFLSVTNVIDKKKTSNVIISMVAGISLITFTLPILSSPMFINAQLGIIFLILYILFLLLSSVLIIVPIKNPVINYKLLKPEKIIVISLLFAVALPLPFLYHSHGWNYFKIQDQVLYFFTLLLPILIFLKYTTKIPQRYINILSIILSLVLISTTLIYIFNSGLLIPSLFIYIYVIILGYDLRDPFKKKKITFKSLLPLSIIIVDLLSITVYLYLLTNHGDLFYSVGMYGTNIFLEDLGFGSMIYLNIILLLVAIVFRLAKLKRISQVMYVLWAVWVTYFTTVLCVRFVFNHDYHMTDGEMFFVPPILIVLYLITFIINKILTKTKM
ncbi:helix-turn-helix transcriptional regulator [Mycoplasmatota bacterium]|nr:helix-turn-helix transcriptional regulator [Mycoplasmatota bacterium]